ncbi:MAG: FIG01040094: hypothetical protein, partial [uncultured Frankineae bacterium]
VLEHLTAGCRHPRHGAAEQGPACRPVRRPPRTAADAEGDRSQRPPAGRRHRLRGVRAVAVHRLAGGPGGRVARRHRRAHPVL